MENLLVLPKPRVASSQKSCNPGNHSLGKDGVGWGGERRGTWRDDEREGGAERERDRAEWVFFPWYIMPRACGYALGPSPAPSVSPVAAVVVSVKSFPPAILLEASS